MSRKGFSNLELMASLAIISSITLYVYSGIFDKKDTIISFYQNYADKITDSCNPTEDKVNSILLQISKLSEEDQNLLFERLNKQQ
jgi:hypothetical protein